MNKASLLTRLMIKVILACMVVAATAAGQSLSKKELLGKNIFFDESLSAKENQSCGTCHAPESGWTGPSSEVNDGGAVYEGSIQGRFGDRKPPSAAYATQSPVFYPGSTIYIGGNFWDGRATGMRLGNPAAEQALGPFLNPMEQALPKAKDVVARVCASSYGELFRKVWGDEFCLRGNEAEAYDKIGYSIAAYEASSEVNAFSSKYDAWLMGRAALTAAEKRGLALFTGPRAKCANCHPATGVRPLFTDYTYDNLGIPKNLENPVYDRLPRFVDLGLGGFLKSLNYSPAVYKPQLGKVKVPTLRNVDMRPSEKFVKAYGHNGYFKSLEEIVHFYNTRDVLPRCGSKPGQAEKVSCWPAPELAANVNTTELGKLGLTARDEADIVAFLKTLSDHWGK